MARVLLTVASLGLLLGGCSGLSGSTPSLPPPAEGKHPGACSWLRVDAEGSRRRTERTYDGERVVTEITFEENESKRSVRSRRFVYDAQGRQIRIDEFEGPSRHSSYMSYDEQGRWISTEIDASGTRDVVRRNERGYDPRGRVTYSRTVSEPDGKVLELHRYEHSERGQIVLERIDLPVEGTSKQIEFQHDERGRVVERHHREMPTETLTQRDVYAFGPSGRLESMVRHGAVRLTQRYRHDGWGNLLRVDTWDDAGEPIAATVYDYSCWP